MLLNCKMVKIAPYNSQANLSERYNKLALASLRIFHQSYGLNEQNFDLLLSLSGQMLNYQLLRCGYSPYFLHTVSQPSLNKQIFRILRRTMTNAVIFPFNKRFYQSRFKREGKIPKQYCSIQRITNLKPIRNVYKLLDLSIPQKMVIELSAI